MARSERARQRRITARHSPRHPPPTCSTVGLAAKKRRATSPPARSARMRCQLWACRRAMASADGEAVAAAAASRRS
jgi:hypothetical protein